MNFTITNQNVKHDILVQLNRTSPLTDQEKEFLSEMAKEHGVSAETLTSKPFPTTFGEKSDFLGLGEAISGGGDNISDNFGKTSRFHVCSDNPSEYESKKTVEEADSFDPEKEIKNVKLRISYCFSGTVKKESKNVIEEGKLSLGASYNYDTDNKSGSSTHDKEVELNYKAEKAN